MAKNDAIALLKADHRKVEDLFEKYEKARGKKADIAHKICLELTIHTMIEEEIFYPACREAGVESDKMDEAKHESHRLDSQHPLDRPPFRRGRFHQPRGQKEKRKDQQRKQHSFQSGILGVVCGRPPLLPSQANQASAEDGNQQAVAILRIRQPFHAQVIQQTKPQISEREQNGCPTQGCRIGNADPRPRDA